MASISLPTNSRNEAPNPYHDLFRLSLGKMVLHGTPNVNKDSATLQKRRDSIKSMPYVGSGLCGPNSSDRIFSSSWYNYPQNHVCSIWLNPIFTSVPVDQVIFTSVHCSKDMKRKYCHTPSIKTAISHSKLIKQTELTEKRWKDFLMAWSDLVEYHNWEGDTIFSKN